MPPDEPGAAIYPAWSRTRDTKGGEHRHVSRDEALGRAWLSWRSHGCDHGLKPHKIGPAGAIRETGDRAPEATSRRKPKAVSSRQWGQR